MRKVSLLWALFCLLSLSACATMSCKLNDNPATSKLHWSRGSQTDLVSYLQRLNGTKVEHQKGGVCITIPSDSLFQPDGDRVKLSNAADMEVLAKAGKKYPHLQIRVNAYTDCTNSETQELVLSELEAWLIKQALVESGISARRISAQGWGESRPIASNATADGRKANRRVTITFEQRNS